MGGSATAAVNLGGANYPAEPIAGGAAYEIFTGEPGRRFVHRSDLIDPPGAPDLDTPLRAPLSKAMTWDAVHRLSQVPPRAPMTGLLADVRATATIRRGTRMVKPLTARGVAEVLKGSPPHGFCYREYDVAHLRTPQDWSVLTGEGDAPIAFALRWRAIDPLDYVTPGPDSGLTRIAPHDRLGPPVLGTGFAPSGNQLIPEFLSTDSADLPMSANAALLAYTEDGTEVPLYTYQAEQRAWLRLAGPQWRHILATLRDVRPEQEYLAMPQERRSATRLVGWFQGQEYEAIADPPEAFRVLAMTRAARYAVERLRRRTSYGRWRGEPCTVLQAEAEWCRLRLVSPTQESIARTGAQCFERGVYEVWAPRMELTELQDIDVEYRI